MAQSVTATPKVAKVIKVDLYRLQCPDCHSELHRQVSRQSWRDMPSLLTCSQCGVIVSVPEQPEGGRMAVWNRDNTLDLFQRQLYALQSEIVCNISKYVLEVKVKGKTYTAVVEGYSHDYWTHRIDRHDLAKQMNMVICYRHTSCVRQKVLELCSPTGREYEAFSPPHWFDLDSRGGRAWAQVFTGALLAGHGEAYEELEKIREESPAAYYRYLDRKAHLAAYKWGRPTAV